MRGEGGEDDDSSEDPFLRAVADAPEVAIGSSATLAAGAVIAGRFRLEARLGEGGMGVVWSARHVVTRKTVALKFVKFAARERQGTHQRFLREARAACAVRHPSVVEVHDVLVLADGSPVMVMDLLEGETLAARLAREHTLPLAEVARIMIPVCAGVDSAHALGIVHRDLKPENIFLSTERDGMTAVKVLDFGIAKLTATEGDAAHSGATTGTGMLLGTPMYMAPEQIFGERDIDHRADIWAIGVILYECFAGRRPTQAANVGQIFKIIMTDAIKPIATAARDLEPSICSLIDRMLTRDRERRPASLREVAAALSAHGPPTSTFDAHRARSVDTSQALSAGEVAWPVVVPSDGATVDALDDTVEVRERPRRALSLSTPGSRIAITALGAAAVGVGVWGAFGAHGSSRAGPLDPPVTTGAVAAPVASILPPLATASPASSAPPMPAVSPASSAPRDAAKSARPARPVVQKPPAPAESAPSAPPQIPAATSAAVPADPASYQ